MHTAVKAVAVCPVEQQCLDDYMRRLVSQGVSGTFVGLTQGHVHNGPLQHWPHAGLHVDTAAHRAAFRDLCLPLPHLQELVDCSKLLLKPRLGDVQLEALLPQRVLDRQAPTGVPVDRRVAPLRLPSTPPIVTWVCTFKRWRQIGVDPRWTCNEVMVNSAAWTKVLLSERLLSLQRLVWKKPSSCCLPVHVGPTRKVGPDSSAGSEKAFELIHRLLWLVHRP